MSQNLEKQIKKHPHWKQTFSICRILNKNGFKAWLCGGAVRDVILKTKAKDFDIATDATPEEVEKLFKKTINVGKDFGAIKVIYNGATIDVVSFRQDGLYIDGRRPTSIKRSTPEQDAQRRDFTINALFYDPQTKKLYDYVNGLLDIKGKLIQTVGNAEHRFTEDKLRMLRAARFASQLGFKIHNVTMNAIKNKASEINVVSGERIYEEINKLLLGKSFVTGIDYLNATGLVKYIFNIYELNLKQCKLIQKEDALVKWIFILSHLPFEERVVIYNKLKVSNDFKTTVEDTLTVLSELKIFNKLKLSEQKILSSNKNMRRAIILYNLEVKLPASILRFINKNNKLPKPYITSKQLLKKGMKPSKQFGLLLDKAYHAQLNLEFKNAKQALIWLDKILLSNTK